MHKKQVDRRPDGKPAEQGAGKYDPTRPAPDRKAPEVPEENKGFGKPEGHPIDKPTPKPGTRFGRKDIFEGERSDRESGRPVQLEVEDDDDETSPAGRMRSPVSAAGSRTARTGDPVTSSRPSADPRAAGR